MNNKKTNVIGQVPGLPKKVANPPSAVIGAVPTGIRATVSSTLQLPMLTKRPAAPAESLVSPVPAFKIIKNEPPPNKKEKATSTSLPLQGETRKVSVEASKAFHDTDRSVPGTSQPDTTPLTTTTDWDPSMTNLYGLFINLSR